MSKSKLQFTSAELEQIRELAAEAEAIEQRMNQLERHELKEILQSAAARFAAGEIDLATATLAAAGTASGADWASVASELRHACKSKLRELYLSADPYIRSADSAAVESARESAEALERLERDRHVGLAGLPAESFEPSPALQALRRKHSELLQHTRRSSAPTKTDFSRLLAAI